MPGTLFGLCLCTIVLQCHSKLKGAVLNKSRLLHFLICHTLTDSVFKGTPDKSKETGVYTSVMRERLGQSTAVKEIGFVTLVTVQMLSHIKMIYSQNYYCSAYKCWIKEQSVLEFWLAVIRFSAWLGGESMLEEHIALEGGCLFSHL